MKIARPVSGAPLFLFSSSFSSIIYKYNVLFFSFHKTFVYQERKWNREEKAYSRNFGVDDIANWVADYFHAKTSVKARYALHWVDVAHFEDKISLIHYF